MNESSRITAAVSDMERYLFDLNGYLILKGALSRDEVAACNATYDELEDAAKAIDGRGWHGNVSVNNSGKQEGLIFQQLYEAGPVWETLLDHPSWYDKAVHFIGTDDPENFDGHHGHAFIDECFGTIRATGGAQRLHSGGHVGTIRTQFRYVGPHPFLGPVGEAPSDFLVRHRRAHVERHAAELRAVRRMEHRLHPPARLPLHRPGGVPSPPRRHALGRRHRRVHGLERRLDPDPVYDVRH
jgi:hypothetical protein